jgi:hypothetical protein
MIQVSLSNTDRVALIDDADAELICAHRWWMIESPSSTRPSFYARGCIIGQRYQPLMHRLIMGQMTDHVNGNGLDNRRVNLRAATRSQNGGNRRKAVATGSRFKGVTPYVGHPGRWLAYITINRSRMHLGIFDGEEQAGHAYDDAARDLFGEFAALNFPRIGEQAALAAIGAQ